MALNKCIFVCLIVVYTFNFKAYNIEIISLGSTCITAHVLRLNNMRNCAYPLDWLITPFDGLIKAIEENFSKVLTGTDIVIHGSSKAVSDIYEFRYLHSFPGKIDNNIEYNDQYDEHLTVNILVDDWKNYIDSVRLIFNYRLKRLNDLLQNGTPVILVRYDNQMGKNESLLFYNLLKSKYINSNFDLFIIGAHDELKENWNLKNIYNLYLDEKNTINPWAQESMQEFSKLFVVIKKYALSKGQG